MSKAVTEKEKQQTINKAVKWAHDIAEDNSHGYPPNFTKNFVGPDYKCTTLVYFAWYYAGVFKKSRADVARDWATLGTHKFNLYIQRRDDFRNVKNKVGLSSCDVNTTKLEKGDILMRDTSSGAHVAQYYGRCRLSEAAGDSDGKVGDGSRSEIHNRSYYYGSWNAVYRYTPEIAMTHGIKAIKHTRTKLSKKTTKRTTGKKKKTTKHSSGKSSPSKSYDTNPLVRQDLTCEETDLTQTERDYCTLAPNRGGEGELIQAVSNVLSAVYIWVGILAVIFIVVGGIKYMTSAGSPEKIKNAKNTIMYAIIGLVVTLLAFAITGFIIGAVNGT